MSGPDDNTLDVPVYQTTGRKVAVGPRAPYPRRGDRDGIGLVGEEDVSGAIVAAKRREGMRETPVGACLRYGGGGSGERRYSGETRKVSSLRDVL